MPPIRVSNTRPIHLAPRCLAAQRRNGRMRAGVRVTTRGMRPQGRTGDHEVNNVANMGYSFGSGRAHMARTGYVLSTEHSNCLRLSHELSGFNAGSTALPPAATSVVARGEACFHGPGEIEDAGQTHESLLHFACPSPLVPCLPVATHATAGDGYDLRPYRGARRLHLAKGYETYVGIARCPKNGPVASVVPWRDAPPRAHGVDHEVCPHTSCILWRSARRLPILFLFVNLCLRWDGYRCHPQRSQVCLLNHATLR